MYGRSTLHVYLMRPQQGRNAHPTMEGGDKMSTEQMVAELKKRGYTNIKVKGGMVPLEKAPTGNVYYMYMRITGKLGGKVNVKTV